MSSKNSLETEHLVVNGRIFNKEFCCLREHVKQLKKSIIKLENEIGNISILLSRFTYNEDEDCVEVDAKGMLIKDVT